MADGDSDPLMWESQRLSDPTKGRHLGPDRGPVVSQIRASSRPQAEERGPADVRRALEAALRVTHNEMQHRARLVTEMADAPRVSGSELRLEQVFVNLLVNAMQALPDGRKSNEIRVSLGTSARGEVVVEVADNGPGIPDEIRARIFNPFFTTKGVGTGLGLGLSICHGIVTWHDGTITVDSVPGRGSTFRIVLPALAKVVGAETSIARPKGTRGRPLAAGLRVLVVDDEPLLAAMIGSLLEDDCQVDVAVQGRAALDRLARATTPYDVILCDLMMPGMTGMELYDEVVRLYPGLEERFVFMTGGAFTPRAIEFLARVKNRRLEKPFDSAALRAVIARPAVA